MTFLPALLVLLTLVVALGLPLALLGLPVTAPTVLVLAAALTPLAWRARLQPLIVVERWPRPVVLLARVALIAAVTLFVAKVVLAPLWSWDHFAIWGMKSRRMVIEGRLDLAFLASPGFEHSLTQYPLGLPMLWRLLALGGLPGTGLFKTAHLLFGLALVAVTRRGVLRLGRPPAMADALAALLAASPLLWDTIALGLADLPLALWATAGLVLALESAEGRPAGVWPVGVCLGFLPWIKQEGLTLALLALVASAVIVSTGKNRKARLAALLLPAGLLIAGALAIGRTLPEGSPSFFIGDWRARALARLSQPGEILTKLGSDLVALDWLGFWFLFATGLALALWRRNRTAILLGGVVVIQLGLYAAVYFLTYLPPADHVHSSFTRIAAALVPPGILMVAAVWSRQSALLSTISVSKTAIDAPLPVPDVSLSALIATLTAASGSAPGIDATVTLTDVAVTPLYGAETMESVATTGMKGLVPRKTVAKTLKTVATSVTAEPAPAVSAALP